MTENNKEQKLHLFQKVKIRILLFLKEIYRIFNFKTVYFFDTNMMVSNSRKDKRLSKLFTVNRNYFITEKNNEEVANLLKISGYHKINNKKFKILSFNDLRESNPEVCPVYYNFILQMNNPAVVLSQNFFASRINALILNKTKLSSEEETIKNQIFDHLKKITQEGKTGRK